jgi:uncharacterized UBP type Zn finger protein
MSEIEPFVVKNACNTCYIDSLLMGLFFNPSNISNILENDPENVNAIYLQEYIKVNFVNNVRDFKTVDDEIINMIRTLCFQNGWRNNEFSEFFEQQDVNEFYHFLINIMNGDLIEIQRETITQGAIPDENDIGKVVKEPFISLSIPTTFIRERKSVTIREMLDNWMYDNCLELKRYVMTSNGKEEKLVQGLNINRIINLPILIPLVINRFTIVNGETKRLDIDIIIQQKIAPFKNVKVSEEFEITQPSGILGIEDYKWSIHAVICHRGDNLKSGHYYCLINFNGSWLLFDDLTIPCIREVSMKDPTIVSNIKSDCVFLLYNRCF